MTQKRFLPLLILAISALLIGCSSNPVSKQTRTDLTAEHVRGLYADMDRSDVEDLLGKSDSALAENESYEMYSLADGTYAVLRYAGDKLQAAYIRGKDNIEEAIFSNYQGTSSSTINDGTTDDSHTDTNGADASSMDSDDANSADSADTRSMNSDDANAMNSDDANAADSDDANAADSAGTDINSTGRTDNTRTDNHTIIQNESETSAR